MLFLDGPDVAPRIRCCGCIGGECEACAPRGGCPCHGLRSFLEREPTDDEIRGHVAKYAERAQVRISGGYPMAHDADLVRLAGEIGAPPVAA